MAFAGSSRAHQRQESSCSDSDHRTTFAVGALVWCHGRRRRARLRSRAFRARPASASSHASGKAGRQQKEPPPGWARRASAPR
eukprot:9234332-Alexandrium_andersonii.AAC.1